MAASGDVHPALGTGLRRLRTARRLSLSEVAEATGLSPSFLSLLENGKSDITIGRLTRLVNFFGVSITDLLPSEEPADPHVVGLAERRRLHSPSEGTDIFLLVHDTERAMMPMYLEIQPGGHLAEFAQHRGEEWVFVIEGELTLELDGTEARRLEAGDSAYYSAETQHMFRNRSTSQPVRLVCVNTPPIL